MINSSILQVVIHCNSCGRDTRHDVLYEVRRPWEESQGEFDISGSDDFQLLSCRGCLSLTLHRQSWMSEDVEPDGSPVIHKYFHPPRMHRRLPQWIDDIEVPLRLTDLVREIYVAMDAAATRLAAMGVRALLEHVMIEAVKDRGSFKKNLDAFEADGHVSARQRQFLESTLEIGHATTHRGYTPSYTAIGVCLDVAENLLAALYVLPETTDGLQRQLPKRKRRPKSGKGKARPSK